MSEQIRRVSRGSLGEGEDSIATVAATAPAPPATGAPARPVPSVAAPPAPVALTFLRGRDADGRIQRLVAERRGLRPALGTLALRLLKRGGVEKLGFRLLGDYARERLGVTATVVREWARVAEALVTLPALQAAVASGEVSWSVARRAVGHASVETDAVFVEALRGRTVRAAEEMLRAAFAAEEVGEEKEDPGERVRVSVPIGAAHHERWIAALELARKMAGQGLPVWECAEAIAAEGLGAISPALVAQADGATLTTSASPRSTTGGLCEDPSATRTGQQPRAGTPPSREHGLRHEAFPLLRWSGGGASGAGDAVSTAIELDLDRLASWAETASPHALDAALREAIGRLQRVDHDLGQILRQVLERNLHHELGFPSFARYAEERVDVSPRTARRWVRLARLGPMGSPVASAFRAGVLSSKQAAIVLESVPPAQQPEVIAFAQRVTLRRLEADTGSEAPVHGTVVFSAPPEAANLIRLALEAARLQLEAHGQPAPSPADALGFLLDHAIAAWTEQGDQFDDYADFTRDGFRCTMPGCTARRNLHSHHIVFRSHQGVDLPRNRTTLCAFHHQRGIHTRVIRLTGLAPDRLTYELGLRNDGPPLLRVGSHDVILGA